MSKCQGCGQPEADPMVVVNDSLPSLTGQRFHAGCFREALEAAVLTLEAQGAVTVERAKVQP